MSKRMQELLEANATIQTSAEPDWEQFTENVREMDRITSETYLAWREHGRGQTLEEYSREADV